MFTHFVFFFSSNAGLGGSKEQYLAACLKLNQSTDVLYVLQKNLVVKLLDNTDDDSRTASSRKIFVTKLRKYVIENSLEQRVSVDTIPLYTLPEIGC